MPRHRRGQGRGGQEALDSREHSPENRVTLAPNDRRGTAKALHELLATTQRFHGLVLHRIRDHSGERKRRRIVPKSFQRIPIRLRHLPADAASVPLRRRQPALGKPEKPKGDLTCDGNPTEPMKPRPAESLLRRPRHKKPQGGFPWSSSTGLPVPRSITCIR